MFCADGNGTPNGGPAYGDGGFYKAIGATKISYVEATSRPPSPKGTGSTSRIKRDGLQACDKTIVPIGSVNFTAFALSFKADGCNAAECACVLSSSLAMATALHQAGLNKVKIIFAAGPTQQIYQNAQDEAAANGAYFLGIVSSPTYTNAASLAFLAQLKKYDPSYTGGLPDLGQADGWPVANLMVEGLQVAGKNPTQQVVHHQPAQGRLTGPTAASLPSRSASCILGTTRRRSVSPMCSSSTESSCRSRGDGKPFCGTIIPGSSS